MSDVTMEFQILSKKIIKPSAPTPHEHQTHKLSFLDQMAPKLYVGVVYFYSFDGNDADMVERNEKLQKSLSETLSHYYPLAGRLKIDDVLVECHDQGVLYVEAQVSVELAQFLREGFKNFQLPKAFLPIELMQPIAVTNPLLGIQVTTFQCGGQALVVSCSHALADGFSGLGLVRDWATISRSAVSSTEVICPSFGLADLFPPRKNVPGFQPPPSRLIATADFVTKRFVFDGPTISAMKSKIIASRANSGDDDDVKRQQPTRLVVVMACIWRALIRIARQKHGHLKSYVMLLTLNLRGNLKSLAMPMNSIGNPYVQIPIKFTAEEESKMQQLHHFVALVGDTIQNAFSRLAKVSNADELFTVVSSFLNEVKECMRDSNTDIRLFTSWCKFPLYETDFGWGKPVCVSMTGMGIEMVFFKDTKCGTGIEAMMRLSEKDMLEFGSDPEVVAFTSSSN